VGVLTRRLSGGAILLSACVKQHRCERLHFEPVDAEQISERRLRWRMSVCGDRSIIAWLHGSLGGICLADNLIGFARRP